MVVLFYVFFFKQKTAYEMRISDWSSDVCSSDLPATGHMKKRSFGPWMMRAFGVLAKLKGLRGTAFDPFGRTEERRIERRLIVDYEAVVEEMIAGLDDANHAVAVELASLPAATRGYGPIKQIGRASCRESGCQ